MRPSRSSPIGVGVLTILTVLLVLTLAVFSVLTYTSARADLALSQRNAGMVTAYYAADSEARKLQAQFAQGLDDELEATLPMTDAQNLYIHLAREGGEIRVLAWKTVPARDESGYEPPHLPVFDGALPG